MKEADENKTNCHLKQSIKHFEKKDRIKAHWELQGKSRDLQHVTHDHRNDKRTEGLETISQKTDRDVSIV